MAHIDHASLVQLAHTLVAQRALSEDRAEEFVEQLSAWQECQPDGEATGEAAVRAARCMQANVERDIEQSLGPGAGGRRAFQPITHEVLACLDARENGPKQVQTAGRHKTADL